MNDKPAKKEPSRTKAVMKSDETQIRQSGFGILVLKVAIVLWMLSYLTTALVFLANSWIQDNQLICDLFNAENCAHLSPLFVTGFHAVLGGVMGAGALGLVSFYKHVSETPEFDPSHAWGYLFAPWLAGILGLIVFALLQTGLLVFSGSLGSSEDSELSNLAFLAVGFLSGFGWYDATQKIRKAAKQLFEESKPGAASDVSADIVESEEDG